MTTFTQWQRPVYTEVGGDPFLAEVVLHLKGDNFYDSSPNTKAVLLSPNSSLSTDSKYGISSFDFTSPNSAISVSSNCGLTTLDGVTMEFWAKKTVAPFSSYICEFNGLLVTGEDKGIQHRDVNIFRIFSTQTTTIAVNLNVWNHYAFVFTTGNVKVYLNGVLVSNIARTLPVLNTSAFYLGAGNTLSNNFYGGLIDSFRITKAVRYTANFNPETDTYLNPTTTQDPYIANVVLHLKGEGINNSINIIDSSPTPKTITKAGDVRISHYRSKYGLSSIYQGTNGYLSVPMTYTADFTIESWLYGNNGILCGTGDTGNFIVSLASTGVSIHIGTWLPTIDIGLPSDRWYHLAITRANNIIRVFVDGTQAIATVSNSTTLTGGTLFIFNTPTLGSYFKEYIDSFRITNGVARYTTNFNPETDTFLYDGTPYTVSLEPSEVVYDDSNTFYLGDCKWSNSDILYPNISYLNSFPIKNTQLFRGLLDLLQSQFKYFALDGNWTTGVEAFINFSPAGEPSYNTSYRFSMSPATSGNTRSLALARRSSGTTTVIGGDLLDINEEQFWTSNDEPSPIFERQITAMAGKNSLGFFLLRRKTDATSIIPLFMYCGVLEDVNPNLNYYTGSFERSLIIIIWGYANSSTTPLLYVRHLAGTTARSPLLTLDAVYPIACEDNTIPNSQWATEFFIFDDNPLLGYPRVGKVANMLLSTSPNLTIGKPVYVNGSVITDGGSRWFLPVGYFGGRTMLMRCYSSVEKN